jgi:hypothetical protein
LGHQLEQQHSTNTTGTEEAPLMLEIALEEITRITNPTTNNNNNNWGALQQMKLGGRIRIITAKETLQCQEQETLKEEDTRTLRAVRHIIGQTPIFTHRLPRPPSTTSHTLHLHPNNLALKRDSIIGENRPTTTAARIHCLSQN